MNLSVVLRCGFIILMIIDLYRSAAILILYYHSKQCYETEARMKYSLIPVNFMRIMPMSKQCI